SNRLRRSRIAREECALDRLGEIAQREDGTVGVREERVERARFVGREGFGNGRGEGHGRVIVPRMSEFAYRHRVTVRFRDCDAMGHVNHAVYFTYFEQCRLTCWRELTGQANPFTRVIIARAECDYRSQSVFGDELEVRMTVGRIGRSSFELVYEIAQAATGQKVADGKTVMVSFDYGANKSAPLTVETQALLARLGTDPGPS